VRPEQRHHVGGKFRKLVVELLPDAPTQEGDTLQEALDIRIRTPIGEKPGDLRIRPCELRAHFTKVPELVLVVDVAAHRTDLSSLTLRSKARDVYGADSIRKARALFGNLILSGSADLRLIPDTVLTGLTYECGIYTERQYAFGFFLVGDTAYTHTTKPRFVLLDRYPDRLFH